MKRLITIFCLLVGLGTLGTAQCVKGDCQDGHGTYLFPSGAKYTGSFASGMLDGFGTLVFSNGDKYVGFWSKQYREGKGTLVFANGNKYEGEFKKSKFDGYGKYSLFEGETYLGYWKEGMKHGEATLITENGIKTKSHWENGQRIDAKPEPALAQQSSNQTIAETAETSSETAANKRNCNEEDCQDGEGTYTYRDGSKYVGTFKQNKPAGQGTCYYANGDKYVGEWQNHAPHGEGTMYFTSGRVVGAIWRQGRVVKYRSSDQQMVLNTDKKKDKNDQVKIWAAIIGVASYNHMPTLKYTDDDAYRMYAFLKSPEGGALPDNQINLMIDEDATREQIIRSVHDLYSQADENDVIMLYLSGHGLKGSFLPYDFDGYHNVLKYSEIQELLDKSDAKQKLVFADACYAGTLTASRSTELNESIRKFYAMINEAQAGTAFLMSSKEEEVSLEDQGLRQGIFSHFLMKGLKGEADRDQDKVVRVGELFEYVTRRVKHYTINRQSPTVAGQFDAQLPLAFIR